MSHPPALRIAMLSLVVAASSCTPDESAMGPDLASSNDGPIGAPARDLSVATCSPACSGSTPVCNAMHHCVTCLTDDTCPSGTVCKVLGPAQSQCVKGCSSDARCAEGGGGAMACCGGACISTAASPNNCGACGNVCMVPNAVAACASGKCTIGACLPGYSNCNADPADGCEVAVHVDPKNCGTCGKTCAFTHGTAGCADGCYLTGCEVGYADCDSVDDNGCEVAVDADPRNCGACGVSCTNPANAKGSCVSGACALSCNLNWGDCDNNANNGCERPLSADGNNCGACGNVCPNGLICKAGQCTCPNCNIPNASSKCVNNVCTLDKCNVGFGDCDNNANNGCETGLSVDVKNCGACGNVCPMNLPYCANGVCGKGVDYGPMHTFINQTSDFFLSTGQGCCSVNCAGNAAVDAAYFCLHFYGQPLGMNCSVTSTGTQVNAAAASGWMMHKNSGCTSSGNDIPNTTCDGGACKMWNTGGQAYGGLKGVICHCM